MGGDDFDKRIVDFLADDFKKNEGIDLRKDRQARDSLQICTSEMIMEAVVPATAWDYAEHGHAACVGRFQCLML